MGKFRIETPAGRSVEIELDDWKIDAIEEMARRRGTVSSEIIVELLERGLELGLILERGTKKPS